MLRLILTFIITGFQLTLFSQEIKQNLHLTDSCQSCKERIVVKLNKLYESREYYSRIADIYRDSLGKKYRDKRYRIVCQL